MRVYHMTGRPTGRMTCFALAMRMPAQSAYIGHHWQRCHRVVGARPASHRAVLWRWRGAAASRRVRRPAQVPHAPHHPGNWLLHSLHSEKGAGSGSIANITAHRRTCCLLAACWRVVSGWGPTGVHLPASHVGRAAANCMHTGQPACTTGGLWSIVAQLLVLACPCAVSEQSVQTTCCTSPGNVRVHRPLHDGGPGNLSCLQPHRASGLERS